MIEAARAVADAVLYEGFFLFPYSKSAIKNQMPFQFGVLMPANYADKSEPSQLHSEFVLLRQSAAQTRLEGVLRFLEIPATGDPREREVPFAFALGEAGQLPFQIGNLHGTVAMSDLSDGEVVRVTLDVRNHTSIDDPHARRNDALRGAFVSAHVLLAAPGAQFASMLDPPEKAIGAIARCRNERVFPVLLGEAGLAKQTGTMLLISPIILYDFPRIAKTSTTRTFDGTEIDELLMLSVASLSDKEKQEARAAHPFVRELVERAESLDADTQGMLHGALTGGSGEPGDETVTIDGVPVRRGCRVRVQPKGRADVWDDIVRGMTARVNAVHTDFEGKRHIGVVFDADPASDMHDWYGRSFFYSIDEIEPLP